MDADKALEAIPTAHALQYYKNHCEFFGYSIEETSESSIICHHSKKDTLRLVLLNYGAGVMAQIFYKIPEKFKYDPNPLYIYANDLNYRLIFMKACITGVETGKIFITLSSVIEGDYNRKNFAIFLDNIDNDMVHFHSLPQTRNIWDIQD